MPQVIPYIFAYIGYAAEAGSIWGAIGFWGAIISSAVVAAYEQQQARSAARDSFNASLKDRLVMTSTTDGPRSLLYGRVRNVDGLLFKATHGANKEFYTLVVAVAGCEVDGIEDVYFNDIKVTIDGNGYVQTAPYMRSDKISRSFAGTITGGTAVVTLDYTPILNTVGAVQLSGGVQAADSGTVIVNIVSVVGSVVTVSGSADGPFQLSYQSASDISFAKIIKHNGAPNQDISAELNALVPGLITVGRHRFQGIALLVVTLQFNSDAFPQGVPNISAVTRGIKVYDPRNGQVSWTSVSAPSTGPHPGENPALCALDWARQQHGGALSLPECVVDSFANAANDSDVITDFANTVNPNGVWTDVAAQDADFAINPAQRVRYGATTEWVERVVSGVGHCTVAFFGSDPAVGTVKTCQVFHPEEVVVVPEARYRCGTVARTDSAADSVFADFVQAMAGISGWSGGLLRVRAGAWRLPLTTHITEDWVSDQGAMNCNPGTATQDTFNIVTASISDAEHDYVAVPLPEIRAEPYITQDGIELPITMQMNAVTKDYHAQDIVEVLMLEARQAVSLQLPCKLDAFVLDLFDIVPVDLSVYGFVGKNFEVRGWSFTMQGGVTLLLREIAATSYDPATLFTLNDLADNTELPNPWIVEPVLGLTAYTVVTRDNDEQLVTRTQVTWLPMRTAAVIENGQVEIQWASLGLAPTTMTWINDVGETVTWQNDFEDLMEWVGQQESLLTDNSWNRRLEPGYATSTLIIGLRAGFAYLIRARGVTEIGHSPWCNQLLLLIPTMTSSDIASLAAAQAAAAAAAADAAQAKASAENANAAVHEAITEAQAAQVAADAATAAIDSFISDGSLSPPEKNALIIDYNSIIAERFGIEAEAVDYDITTELTDYGVAIDALTAYLNTVPGWDDTSVSTPIDGPALRAAFVNVYTKRQIVLNKIAEIAGTRAAWASITGIPYDAIFSNDDATSLGFNPTFSAWTGAFPDGWSLWSGTAPIREDVLVGVGLYGVKYIAAGGDLGMQTQAAWTTTPMRVGTFIAGAVDMYLVARTSGLPAAVVRLFTNAALTTFVDTNVLPPSAGIGNWQRTPFTARVGDTERIYGIHLFVMGSYGGLGPFFGTVVFDNFRVAFFDDSIDNTSITIGTNGTLSGAGGGQVTISGLGFTGDLDATYGADATNFLGHIGAGNLVRHSAFRVDVAPVDGLADGWGVYNNTGGTEPAVATIAEGGGMFGGNAQVVTWAVNNTSTKGILTAANLVPPGGLVGGWEPNTTYVISWYARASGTNIATSNMSPAWNINPASQVALLNPPLSNAFQRYAYRITWGATTEDDASAGLGEGRFYLTITPVGGLTKGGLSFSAVQATKGDVLTEYMETVEDIRLQSVQAQATADAAQADATLALSTIGGAVSDNVLTPLEKKGIVAIVTQLLGEQGGYDGQANSHAITTQKNNYDAAIVNLNGYLATLISPKAWNDLSGPTNVVGTQFKAFFAIVYANRQALLNEIARIEIVAANTALTNAAAAQSTANQAYIWGQQATIDINNISSDNIISQGEKAALIRDFNMLYEERPAIDAQADVFGGATASWKYQYDVEWDNFFNYSATLTVDAVTGGSCLWNNPNCSTVVNGPLLRTRFSNLLNNKQALLIRIAFLASQRAVWGGIPDVAVVTNQIVDFAVDIPLITNFADSSLSVFTIGSSFRNYDGPTWANSFGRGVTVQLEVSVRTSVTGAGTATGRALGSIVIVNKTANTSMGTYAVLDNGHPLIRGEKGSNTLVLQAVVPPGVTVGTTMNLTIAMDSGAGSITANYEATAIRMTVIFK